MLKESPFLIAVTLACRPGVYAEPHHGDDNFEIVFVKTDDHTRNVVVDADEVARTLTEGVDLTHDQFWYIEAARPADVDDAW